MSCTGLVGNTGRKNRHFGTITQLCQAISSELRHVSTIGKKTGKTAIGLPAAQVLIIWLTSAY